MSGPLHLTIDVLRCTGCGRCVAACLLNLLSLEVSGYRKHAVFMDDGRCSGCGHCIEECPVGVIAAADVQLLGSSCLGDTANVMPPDIRR